MGSESPRKSDTLSIMSDFVNVLEYFQYWIFADSYYGSLEVAEMLHNLQLLFIVSCG